MPASVRYRGDRGAWFVYYRVGAKRWSRRIKQGEERARAVAANFNAELEEKREREIILYSGGPAPFDVIAKAWWDAMVTSMPASSRVSKHCVVHDRLIPFWGDKDIRRIDEDLVRGCAAHWIDERNHARETIETTGSILDSILKWAIAKGYADHCPALRSTTTKGVRSIFRRVASARAKPRGRVEAWSKAQANVLIGAAYERADWLGDPILFAAQTGCRRGEIIALEWADVDLEGRRATIRQSQTRGQYKTTKADKIREVYLMRQAAEMLQRRATDGRSGRVFRDPKGKPWTDYSFSGYWTRARRAAVKEDPRIPPLKFHCWRHTYATWALASGHDPAWCAAQIGDTLEVFLRRYSHAMPGIERSLDFLELSLPRDAGHPPESFSTPDLEAGAAPSEVRPAAPASPAVSEAPSRRPRLAATKRGSARVARSSSN